MQLYCLVKSLLADLQSVMRIARSAKLQKNEAPDYQPGASELAEFWNFRNGS